MSDLFWWVSIILSRFSRIWILGSKSNWSKHVSGNKSWRVPLLWIFYADSKQCNLVLVENCKQNMYDKLKFLFVFYSTYFGFILSPKFIFFSQPKFTDFYTHHCLRFKKKRVLWLYSRWGFCTFYELNFRRNGLRHRKIAVFH